MKKILICILVLSLTLIGCGQNIDPAKETKKESAASKGTEQSEQNVPEVPKEEQKVEQQENTADSASNSSEEKQPDPKTNTTSQSTQQTSQTKTATSKATTSQNTTKNSSNSTAQPSNPAGSTTSPNSNTNTNTNTTAESQKPATTVTLSIIGPKDRGTILSSTKVSFKEGDTIFDIIKQTTKSKGIVVDSRGSGATAYIEGIDNIYEFDYGAKSGWVFKHNGASINKSIGVITVKDGDRIECFYTE